MAPSFPEGAQWSADDAPSSHLLTTLEPNGRGISLPSLSSLKIRVFLPHAAMESGGDNKHNTLFE